MDKLVVLKLNGGLGTTMGCTGPKYVTFDPFLSLFPSYYLLHVLKVLSCIWLLICFISTFLLLSSCWGNKLWVPIWDRIDYLCPHNIGSAWASKLVSSRWSSRTFTKILYARSSTHRPEIYYRNCIALLGEASKLSFWCGDALG